MTSVSEEVRKIDPARSSSPRTLKALTRLPLWAMAISPLQESMRKGCALTRLLLPAVE